MSRILKIVSALALAIAPLTATADLEVAPARAEVHSGSSGQVFRVLLDGVAQRGWTWTVSAAEGFRVADAGTFTEATAGEVVYQAPEMRESIRFIVRAANSEDPDLYAEAAVTVSAAPRVRFQGVSGLGVPAAPAGPGDGGSLPLIRDLRSRQDGAGVQTLAGASESPRSMPPLPGPGLAQLILGYGAPGLLPLIL